jgi:hypothetical protein
MPETKSPGKKKRLKASKRDLPSIIHIAARCVNPEYREDYKTLYSCGGEKEKKHFFEKYYPTYTKKPIDPFFDPTDKWWERLARRGGRFDGPEGKRDFYFLARLGGGVEAPGIPGMVIQGASDAVRIIPCGWDYEKPKGLPTEGYDPLSMRNLLDGRFLYLKLDLWANDDALAKRVKGIVHDYKSRMLLEGRNRDEKMKYLALFRVEHIANERRRKDKRFLITKDRSKLRALDKEFSRARTEAKKIFLRLGLPS